MTETTQAITRQDFVALSPSEMTTAHEDMLRWAVSKVEEMKVQAFEFAAELDLAKRNGWRTRAFERHMKVAEARRRFYEKIVAALRAGYIVVPNFAMTVFAIRTAAGSPKGAPSAYKWDPPAFTQGAQRSLPAGAGSYVAPEPTLETWVEPAVGDDGKPFDRKWARPVDFDDVDFPLAVAKPQIMGATAQAMALQVFDEIGVTQEWAASRSGDPIVLGRLLNPRQNAPSVTFFIGWYFDARRV